MHATNADVDAHGKKVTEQSVSKTREMLKLVNECKDAGVNTLQNLYEQGDQLSRTETALNDTSEQLSRAQIRINNIKRANNVPCCCLPCISCCQTNPDRKQKQMTSNSATQRRIQSTNTTDKLNMGNANGESKYKNENRFFKPVSGTQYEEEMESNLTQVSENLTELKGIALGMNVEVIQQNDQLDRMNDTAQKTAVKLDNATKTTTDLVNDTESSQSICSCCPIC